MRAARGFLWRYQQKDLLRAAFSVGYSLQLMVQEGENGQRTGDEEEDVARCRAFAGGRVFEDAAEE